MREDFILDDDGDFPLEDNVKGGVYLETPYGESDQQHITDGIISDNGSFKQYPTSGFGAEKYLNSEASMQTMEKFLSIEMENDGYRISNGVISPNDTGGYDINQDFISPK